MLHPAAGSEDIANPDSSFLSPRHEARMAQVRDDGDVLEDQLVNLLEKLHAHGVKHDAGEPDRLDRFRNLEPDTARLLALLVRATGARRLLELGTSNGYSTLWLADAVRSVGGRLISVDNDAGRQLSGPTESRARRTPGAGRSARGGRQGHLARVC